MAPCRYAGVFKGFEVGSGDDPVVRDCTVLCCAVLCSTVLFILKD